jgi:hypothetical protein
MSDDYAVVDGAESDLDTFGAEEERSGFDSLATTREGIMVDEFRKDAGLTIDTVGDAKKAAESKEKREKNSESGIAAAFEGARHHVDNHKYDMKLDGKDYQISHGEMKNFLKDQTSKMQDRIKGEKNVKKRQQMQQDLHTMQRLQEIMENNEKLTAEQMEEFQGVLDRNEEMKADFKAQANVRETTVSQDQESKIALANPKSDFSKAAEKEEPETVQVNEIAMISYDSVVSMSGDLNELEALNAEESPAPAEMQVAQVSNISSDMNLNF